jgi:hypothetical protein
MKNDFGPLGSLLFLAALFGCCLLHLFLAKR